MGEELMRCFAFWLRYMYLGTATAMTVGMIMPKSFRILVDAMPVLPTQKSGPAIRGIEVGNADEMPVARQNRSKTGISKASTRRSPLGRIGVGPLFSTNVV